MGKKKRSPSAGGVSVECWKTAKGRVQWLLQNHYGGNRSAMSKATKVSLTGIIKVVTGQQEPGRRLLTAIAENTDVSPAWLLTGLGPPFRSSALPVANQALPGAPQDHADLLVKGNVSNLGDLYSPTRYWLKVRGNEPIVRDPVHKVQAGDLLLMETARALFPPRETFFEKLCVIRLRTTDDESPQYKLAEVSHSEASIEEGPEHLAADTFDMGLEVTTQTVIEERPGEESRVFKRYLRRETRKEGSRRVDREVPVRPADLYYEPLRITDDDIIAVCMLMIRQHGSLA